MFFLSLKKVLSTDNKERMKESGSFVHVAEIFKVVTRLCYQGHRKVRTSCVAGGTVKIKKVMAKVRTRRRSGKTHGRMGAEKRWKPACKSVPVR